MNKKLVSFRLDAETLAYIDAIKAFNKFILNRTDALCTAVDYYYHRLKLDNSNEKDFGF